MSSLSRSNLADPEDCDSCVSDWIAEAFECYEPPSHPGQEMIDPLDERILHSCQSCYLGPAYLKLDLLPAIQVHFYKVSKSEISKPMDPRRQLAPGQDSTLPPKKRKKRRIWHSLIFRLAKTYYVFPQHALMDVINTVAPFQIFCTFYLSKGCDSINVDISGASGDIYHALKETVSEYQVLCQKMKQLLYVHQQQMNEWIPKVDHVKVEETTLTTKRQYIKKKQQNDNKITKRTYKKKHMDAGVKDHGAPTTKKKTTKRRSISDKDSVARQCFHCGVTETPMWRRGPNGGGTLCNACGVKWKNGKLLFNETTGNKRNSLTYFDHVDSMEPTLHEHTDPLTDDHLLRSTCFSDENDTMNVLATNPITATMTRGDHDVSFSTTFSSSSSKCNSPPLVSSFTSSTNSSPPLSMDFQKHPMTLTGKLELEGDTISLAPGADDVEAAALLTLLSQS